MWCGSGVVRHRFNALYSIVGRTRCGQVAPVLQTKIRECSASRNAWRPQAVSRQSFGRKEVTTYLRLADTTRTSIDTLLQRNPLSEGERGSQLLVGVNAEAANEIAVAEEEDPSTSSTIDMQLLVPTPAHDNPHRDVRESLPIFLRRQEILDLINNNQVIVLSGATGSGKTTQVPQYIMEDCAAKQQPCRIICTQPRRLATTSIAERVSNERGDQLGNSVGYQIRLSRRLRKYTNLIFTTSGLLLRRIIGERSSKSLSNVTHLIFDEVHEREEITDFLLIAIKDALKQYPHLKVIVMSATLDADIFCEYFDNCPRIDVPGRMYPVDVIHLGELLHTIGYKSKEMERILSLDQETRSHSGGALLAGEVTTTDTQNILRAYRATSDPSIIDHDLLLAVIKHIHSTQPTDGSILVFLPGFGDITEQQQRIINSIPSDNHKLYLLHSSLNGTDRSDQKRVFEKLPSGQRKIILSTNIAETSLTITDVAHVIDTGKAKLNKFDFRSQTTHLQTVWVSQACAKQRAGRAGRTQSGTCYRLYSSTEYDTFDAYTQPEILRVPLTDICLNSKILFGEGSIEEFLMKAIQPPPLDSIRASIALLRSMDALDENESITSLGVHLAKLPVDAQFAKCILYAILLKCVDPIVTIVSMTTANYPFETAMGRDGGQQKLVKKALAGATYSDHMVKLAAFNGWHAALQVDQQKDYSFENYLIDDNMMMVNGIRSIILGHLKRLRLLNEQRDVNANAKRWPVVKACLTAGLYPNISRIDRKLERFVYNNQRLLAYRTSVMGRSNGKINREFALCEADWAVFDSKQTSPFSNDFQIEGITPVSAVNMALFAGPINLVEPMPLSDHDGDDYLLDIDDMIRLHASAGDAQLVFDLRNKLNRIFVQMLTSKEFVTSSDEDDVIATVADVLEHEDKRCGLD